jgi:hypothetical protein
MENQKFVKVGWTNATSTLCGPYVSLEHDAFGESHPLLFDTQEEAEVERRDFIDDMLMALKSGADFGGEFDEEAERESFESEEFVCLVGVDAAGDVFELDPETREPLGVLHRPDR